MNRIAHQPIFDRTSNRPGLPAKTNPPVFRRVLRCAPHVLLVLAWALQPPAFAAANSGFANPGSSSNLPPQGEAPPAEKSAIARSAGQAATPGERRARCSRPGQDSQSELPPAQKILAQVRANLPRETLLIQGQILCGGRRGKLERHGHVEMLLDFGADPAMACYKISDAFGTPVEEMFISMRADGESEFEYETGRPLQPADAPSPAELIRNTDFTWNDLSLLFLWRTDGRTLRTENLRGRACHVIEFPRAAGRTGENLKTVWIDAQMLVLIQMEELDGLGQVCRRMVVKNIKKISDRWMIKDLEIRSYPSLHHTLIRIDAISP